MRMSCNGCRVLRKGCSDDCIIRPCLQWIKSSDAQANATLFLAKFYGRAGLINLIQAGPQHLRPAVFRSLLYEACGRMVNPVCGSVGLLWSGNWSQCQSAVDSVLRGGNVNTQITSSDADADADAPHLIIDPLRVNYDIRHVSKEPNLVDPLNKVKNRTRFKRPVNKPASPTESSSTRVNQVGESWASQWGNVDNNSNKDDESMFSHETQEPNQGFKFNDDTNQLGLDLTLGLLPIQ